MYFAYGIVSAKFCQDDCLMAGSGLDAYSFIVEGELALVCMQTESEETLSTKSISNYSETLSRLVGYTAVIPLRFGTQFDTEQQIHKTLRQNNKDFVKLLKKLNNKIEIELKVWWKKESFEATMLKNKKLAKWKKAIESGRGQGYDVVEFGQATKEVADQVREELAKTILAVLKPLAVEWVIKDPIDEFQAFQGVFLVDKQQEDAFDEAVGRLYKEYTEEMVFKYTGPWAPHHFV